MPDFLKLTSHTRDAFLKAGAYAVAAILALALLRFITMYYFYPGYPKYYSFMCPAYTRTADGAITFKGGRIPDADADSFRVLGGHLTVHRGTDYPCEDTSLYAVDKNRAYWNGRVVEGIDYIDYFTFVEPDFAKDLHAVYHHASRFVGADASTLQRIPYDAPGGDYWKSKNHIYKDTNGAVDSLSVYDPSTFEILDKNYRKDSEAVYYESDSGLHATGNFRQINGADAATFRICGANSKTARDNNTFYKEDVPTTEPISNCG